MASEGTTSDSPRAEPGGTSALEDVVLDTSRTLMSAHPDEIGTKIEWTLGNVADAFGADRCGAYQVKPSTTGSSLVLGQEWTAEGAEPRPEAAEVLEPGAYPWLFDRLYAFQNAESAPVSGLPEDAAAIRTLLERDGIESAVFLPMVSDWELLGVVSFEAFDAAFTDGDRGIDLVRTFSDMLGHALAQTRRERELQRKNERLEEFASVVSHDLRNPLNVVQASITVARSDPDDAHFDRAADATDRMARIIEQVLTLAKVGRDIGETEAVDPGAVALEAWQSIHAADAALDATGGDPVVADRDRLREVFENLFRNAIEHAGPNVTVRVGPLPDSAGFFVVDDGPGIPEAEREQIFEQGFSTAADGTGLGLSIVSRIVDAHDWEIDVAASASGGARFEIRTGPNRPLGG